MKYTTCPGCDNKVGIWPGDQVNFCCRPCWVTVWDHSFLADQQNREPVNYGHSQACDLRQEARRDEPVQAGEYTLKVSDALQEQVQRLR